jgi:formylglycine-generating enzyme required for sulfatase activity
VRRGEGEGGAWGTNVRIYPWRNQWKAMRCNSEESRVGKMTSVHAYPQGASPYGLVEMTGNVWKWTRDLWGRGD